SGTIQLTSGSTVFYDLTFNDGGGTATYELQDALDVDNDLTITGGTLDTKSGSSFQINVGGNWSNSDAFTANNGLVVMDATSGSPTITSGGDQFYDIEFDDGTNGVTFTIEDALDVENDLTITSGTLDTKSSEDNSINVAGSWINNGGSFNAQQSTVTMDATSGSPQITSNSQAFYNLTLNDGGNGLTFELQDALDVDNNLNISGGTLDANSSSGYNITVGGNWTNSDIFNHQGNTVTFDASSSSVQITSGGDAFNDVTFDDNGNSATFELQDAMDVDGNFTITSGTVDVNSTGNYQINVEGDWTNNDAFTAQSGTVYFDGTGGTISIDAGGSNFYDITFDDGGGSATFQLTSTMTIDNNFTLKNGTVTDNGNQISGNTGGTLNLQSGTSLLIGTVGTGTGFPGGASGGSFSTFTLNS
ncbi:MAG: hypothetical protein ABEH43_00685, partial [Flavobacteriales bacterium]